jgi:hypothetical protein
MLRILQSLFGFGETSGGYPESIVKMAIERAVDGTDPWLRAITGYRKKLRPAVLKAMDHVVSLVEGLPPPIPVSADAYRFNPELKSFFISTEEIRGVLEKDRNLKDFLRKRENGADTVTALMFMEKKESRVFGAEMDGDRVIRDTPRTMVSFESHRLFDPSPDEGKTRLQLKRRAFDYLIRVALQRISAAKSERKDLERRNALLLSKIDILRRGGWGFNGVDSSQCEDVGALEEKLNLIQSQLASLGSDDCLLQTYLDILIDVLGHPEDHLRGGLETMYLDDMGIKREQASQNASELKLYTLHDTNGLCRIARMISLHHEELQCIRA